MQLKELVKEQETEIEATDTSVQELAATDVLTEKDIPSAYQKLKKFISHIYITNARIDAEEKATGHFASGINLYKLMILLFTGSFIGVVVETLWAYYRYHAFRTRVGVVYGPFNLLYGFAIVCMTLCLFRFRNKNPLYSFAGGFIVGSVVEYYCSYFQEKLLGTVSWDYYRYPFNIDGRICLRYSVFWGVLGVLWIKVLYPYIAKLIIKIPDKVGKRITIILTVFLAINGIISLIAVFRWAQRVYGVLPSNPFWEFIDARFHDARMESKYPNIQFVKIGLKLNK